MALTAAVSNCPTVSCVCRIARVIGKNIKSYEHFGGGASASCVSAASACTHLSTAG